MSNHALPESLPPLESSAPNPDRVAANQAEQAYKAGKWLAWAQAGGEVLDRNADAMLSGRYDDRALGELGFNGAALVPENAILTGEPANDVPVYNELDRLSRRHTSPVVRDPARILKYGTPLQPAEISRRSDTVLWYFNGSEIWAPNGNTMDPELFYGKAQPWGERSKGNVSLSFHVPAGKCLVIENIPADGSKQDPYPYTQDRPLLRKEVQVYHNAAGYLVADKVTDDGHRIELPVVFMGGRNEADIQAARDDEWLRPRDDRKQDFPDAVDPARAYTRLLSTTSRWVNEGDHSYDQIEVVVTTPDDDGSIVDVRLDRTGNFPIEGGPIVFRMVDDVRADFARHGDDAVGI